MSSQSALSFCSIWDGKSFPPACQLCMDVTLHCCAVNLRQFSRRVLGSTRNVCHGRWVEETLYGCYATASPACIALSTGLEQKEEENFSLSV